MCDAITLKTIKCVQYNSFKFPWIVYVNKKKKNVNNNLIGR